MEKSKILTASFLDILFDGKNKEYGAYQLRLTYEKRMWQAIAITTAICVAFAGATYIRSGFAHERDRPHFTSRELTITTIEDLKEKTELPKPVELPKAPEVPKIKSVALVTPTIVKDIDVKDPPPSQVDMQEAKISNITQDGVKDIGIVVLPQEIDEKKGILTIIKADDDNGGRPFEKVEIDAKYPGGGGSWKNFLERNLRGDTPVDNSASPGTYTVMIQFVVDKNGNVSEIKALTNLGFGMEAEAIRVIKKSGKWIPAIQNGEAVKAYRKQPVTFRVLEQ